MRVRNERLFLITTHLSVKVYSSSGRLKDSVLVLLLPLNGLATLLVLLARPEDDPEACNML